MAKNIYDFDEGRREMAGLLGGKGAGLAEMTRLGLPVPPGFTVTTEACRSYLRTGAEPVGLRAELERHLALLERAAGRRLGDPHAPLLLSVRSGARYSMPGMMETVLDIGLTDATVRGLAETGGGKRFAYDSYRRLLQMYGSTVLGLHRGLFESALTRLKTVRGLADDRVLTADDLADLVEVYKAVIRSAAGEDFPQDPREQLYRSVQAVFRSWNSERARLYRRREHIPDDLGTAVNIQMMVFGNHGPRSGTGVAFTRDPATGRPGMYGDYLAGAQGEDVVSGVRDAVPLAALQELDPAAYRALRGYLALLETHYRDLCDVEFTIDDGTLWMLQTRIGKRTAEAAFRIAAQLADEGLITEDEALARVTGEQLGRLLFPRFADSAGRRPLAHGVPASPGAAIGAAVFDSAEAVRRAAAGEKVVLVRRETTPDDLPGMVAAQAVLTSRGGKTSHAAVVARGMGKVCVCGAEGLTVDPARRRLTTPDGTVVAEGDVISVDGTAGTVHLGALTLRTSPVAAYLEAGTDAGDVAADDLVSAVDRLLRHADGLRRMEVRANADTPEGAARARRFGARGIGLCRTEHMFLGGRRRLVEAMILARSDVERRQALKALLPLQRADFTGILAAMDGLPVTVRLLDPPLHEFLPDRTALTARLTAAEARGEIPEPHDTELLAAVESMHEVNPMLGLRGVRLALVAPGLIAMQVRALAEAVVDRRRAGGDPRAEIMVPLVASVTELRLVKAEIKQVLAEVAAATGTEVDLPVGTMIELPRAALTAGRIAGEAEFFSYGTNDLTQTVWGMSRDDVEAEFFPAYVAQGVFDVSPFETLDRDGVGRMVQIATAEGRETRPGLVTGVCGEHGGDPASVHFFDRAGLDYVSCSPFRVPVARLEAARARLGDAYRDTGDTR